MSKELSTSDILAGWAQQITFYLQLTHTHTRDNLFLLQFIMLRKAALGQALFPDQVDLSSSFAGEG